jgi:hypothetical protein
MSINMSPVTSSRDDTSRKKCWQFYFYTITPTLNPEFITGYFTDNHD